MTDELCWVALDAVQDPGNLGTILRTSDAVGAVGDAPHDCQAVAYRHPLVLLMGSERLGRSSEQRAGCDILVRIPMVGRGDSLNLAVATSVLLYELFNQRRSRARIG